MKKRNLYIAFITGMVLLTGCSKSASYYNEQGLEKLRSGDNKAAIENFQKAVKKDDDNIKYLTNLADAYKADDNYSDAADTMAKVVQYVTDKEQDDAYYILAEYCFEAGRYDDGIKAVEDFVNTSYKTYAYYIKGYEMLYTYGFEKTGASLLEQAKNIKPVDAKDYNYMGLVHFYLGEYEDALKYFENAQTAGYKEAFLNVAKVNVILENYSKALSAYELYEKNVGKTAFVSNQKCVINMKLGNYEAAIKDANDGINIANVQEMRTLLYNRVIAYEKNMDYKTALSCMEDYVLKYPDDTSVLDEYEFLKTRN